jgi:hypothetical protein
MIRALSAGLLLSLTLALSAAARADDGGADAAADAADSALPDAMQPGSDAATDLAAVDAAPAPAPAPAEPATPPLPERTFTEALLDLPGEWTSKGELGLDGRLFRDDDDPLTVDKGLGLQGRLELRHRHGPFDQKVRVFGRVDQFDQLRSTLAWEEAFVQVGSERVRLRIGLDLVNWTATEAFHPADVINARNLDSDLENLEKLGEPMVALLLRPFEETTVTLLAMPYRSEPIFPSPRSRLNFVPGVNLRGTRQMVDRQGRLTDDNWGPQAAIVIRQVLGPADLTVHALEHMDRSQPMVRAGPAPILLFQTVRQLGGTYQHAIGALLIKLEGAYRHFVDPKEPLPGIPLTALTVLPDHGELAAGLEWGITHQGGPESTLLLEGQTLLGVASEQVRAALSLFQRDVLLGYRLGLNDESGKELLLSAIFDLDRIGESLVNLTYQQRLGDTWTVRAGLRLFQGKAGDPGFLAPLRNADHLRLTLIRHF